MRILNVLCTVLLCGVAAKMVAQNGTIRGKVSYKTCLEQVGSYKVKLLGYKGEELQTTNIDDYGFYVFKELVPGVYDVEVENAVDRSTRVTGVALDYNKEKQVDIKIKDPCKETSKGRCPICSSKRKVLPIEPKVFVSYNFGGDSLAAERTWKNFAKKGYESFTDDDGQEKVSNVYNNNEREKLMDNCYKWFCRRCKTVF